MIILLGLFLFCAHWAEGVDVECDESKPSNFVGLATSPIGNIVSLGFGRGQNYSTGIKCQVTIRSPFRTYIRMTINTIDIEASAGCGNDFLAFVGFAKDGSQEVKGMFCGDKPPADIISDSNDLFLVFQSNHMKTGRGFNVTYSLTRTKNLCRSDEVECRNRKCIKRSGNHFCDGHDDCGDGSDEENCRYPVAPPLKCGSPEISPIVSEKLMDRIVGGRAARPGSWPWQVDMQVDIAEPNGHFCGGTLINAQWFISAAHCFKDTRQPHQIRIHLGNHHKFKRDPNEQIRYVKEYFIYGVPTEVFIEKGEFSIVHDFAIAKLNAPVKFNSAVQPACLPLQDEELPVGKQCFVSGWGESRGSGSNDVLKQAEHPVQKESTCYQDMVQFENKTMICAGRLEHLNGVCHGDSGGPLVCQKADGRWYLYGAASYVTQINMVGGICGIEKKPSVFTKVSPKIAYINWILSNN